METDELIQMADKFIMGTCKRFPIVLVRGLGTRVWELKMKGRWKLGKWSLLVK